MLPSRAVKTVGAGRSMPSAAAPPVSKTLSTKDVEIVKAPFGTFSVGARIGRGAYAQVYKALWNDTGIYVAIKMFDTSQMTQETIDSVLTEVTLLGRLKHPNILRILGYHRESENLYLMLEYAENGSLLKLVKDLGGIPEDLTCTYIRQVLLALAYLHNAGIIHRDLKAANILLNGKGDVKLADFGVAAVMDESDKHFTVVGSPYWMAPEIIQATGHSVQSDIWSLGCTVIELLTGEPPHFGLNPMTAMFKIVQSPAPIPSDVSPLLHKFLEDCFQKDPNLRPPARELLKGPLFVKPLVANMDVPTIKARVLAQRGASSSSGSMSPTLTLSSSSGSGIVLSSVGGMVRSPSTSSSLSSSNSSSSTQPSLIGRAYSGSFKPRERRDSRVPIPEYVPPESTTSTSTSLRLTSTSGGGSVDDGEDDDDDDGSSDSEASTSLSHGVKFPDSKPRNGSISVSQSGSLLSDISIRVDRNALANKLRASQQGGGVVVSSPSKQVARDDSYFKSLPPGGLSVAASDRIASSTRGVKPQLTHEEETELEVEALKQQLMALEKNAGCKISEETKLVTGSVRSTKAEFLQRLTPSLYDTGTPSMASVCCMTIINNVLWVGSASGSIATFQLPRFEPLKVSRVHKTRISCIIAVGSSRVWCSSEDGGIYVISHHDPSKSKHNAVHDIEHKIVRSLVYVPSDHGRVWSCAVSRKSSQIVVLNKHCEIKFKLSPMEQIVSCMSLSPSMNSVWIGTRGSIIVCDSHGDQDRALKLSDVKDAAESLSTMSVTQVLPVGDFAWCAVGKYIIVYDPSKYTVERVLTLDSEVTCLSIFESAVLAGTADSKIECFDSISMDHMRSLPTLLSDSSGRSGRISALESIPGSLLAGRTGVPALFAGTTSSNKLCLWKTPA